MPDTPQDPLGAIFVDLLAQVAGATHDGPQWSFESDDLDVTLLHWRAEHEVATHANHEVDVILVGVTGTGKVTVDNVRYHLGPGQALLVPKGAARSLRASGGTWSYLSVHRRRRGLWPTVQAKQGQ